MLPRVPLRKAGGRGR
ncbi:hypothetical protein EI555_004153 [Monodon monoceros]|uniref:Uncharacterized protein n=1 Tax=Monodon monoceros TaxID=40151 RepID=A0A4U1EEG3_MONMO|nr:hypothetical protein EI555_004153 [Monodon monoceros]